MLAVLFLNLRNILSCFISFEIVLVCTNVTRMPNLDSFAANKIIFIDFMNSSIPNITGQVSKFPNVEWIDFRNNSDISCNEIDQLRQYYVIETDGNCRESIDTEKILYIPTSEINTDKKKIVIIVMLVAVAVLVMCCGIIAVLRYQ